MKNFAFIFFLFFSISGFGQSVLEFTSNDTIYTTIQSQSEEGIAKIVNSSNEEQVYYWTREIICAPNAWQIAIIDQKLEYAPFVDSAYNDLRIAPQDTNELIVLADPLQTVGIAEVHLNIYLRNNPNIPVLTSIYLFNGGCQSVNTNSIFSKEKIEVFPNPTMSNISIKTISSNAIRQAKIYDFGGNLLFQKQVEELEFSIDLTEFSKGIYLIQLLDKEGRFVSKKVVKE